MEKNVYKNIYIFIALALDETNILVSVHFSMKNIYQSCDLGRAVGRSNINISQQRCLLTDVCVMLVMYRHGVKPGSSLLAVPRPQLGNT